MPDPPPNAAPPESAASRLFARLCRALATAWPPDRFTGVTTMIAVSGGADSVGLLRALDHLLPRSATGRLVVAHYNHRLRGEASDADERFVADLANQLRWECVVERAPRRAESQGGSGAHADVAEESLRKARYEFLTAVAHRCGARYVATAHTADDNVETVLHNLFRGTGPAGLTGIPPFRNLGPEAVLVRPLLGVSRHSIRQTLREIHQPWREDLSNTDQRWQRNWLRGFLLPEIRQRYPHADQAIGRLIAQQAEVMDVIRDDAAQWAARHIAASAAGGLSIEIAPAPRPVVVAALQSAWDGRRWPRREMAERHWSWLAAAATGSAASGTAAAGRGATDAGGSSGVWTSDLPGGLRARVVGGAKVVVEATGAD